MKTYPVSEDFLRWVFGENLCIKFEPNTLIFSKDIKRKPRLEVEKRAITPIITGGVYPKWKTDLYFMIIYLCIKSESNTLIFSEDIKLKVEKGP